MEVSGGEDRPPQGRVGSLRPMSSMWTERQRGERQRKVGLSVVAEGLII